jgi:hypothetical protein
MCYGAAMPLSPDCELNKHTACTRDSAAWSDVRDAPVDCTCRCHTREGIAPVSGL